MSIKTDEGYRFLWKTKEEIGADDGHLYGASYQTEAYDKTEKKNTTLGHKNGFKKQSGRMGGVVTGIGAVLRGPERLTKSLGCGEQTRCKTPQGVPAMYGCPWGTSARTETSWMAANKVRELWVQGKPKEGFCLNWGDTKRAAELKGCRGARGPSREVSWWEREECRRASKWGITNTMRNFGRDPNGGRMSRGTEDQRHLTWLKTM